MQELISEHESNTHIFIPIVNPEKFAQSLKDIREAFARKTDNPSQDFDVAKQEVLKSIEGQKEELKAELDQAQEEKKQTILVLLKAKQAQGEQLNQMQAELLDLLTSGKDPQRLNALITQLDAELAALGSRAQEAQEAKEPERASNAQKASDDTNESVEPEAKHTAFAVGEESQGLIKAEILDVKSEESSIKDNDIEVTDETIDLDTGTRGLILENETNRKAKIEIDDAGLEKLAQLYRESAEEAAQGIYAPGTRFALNQAEQWFPQPAGSSWSLADADIEFAISSLFIIAESAHPQLRALIMSLPQGQTVREFRARVKEAFASKVMPLLRSISQTTFVKDARQLFYYAWDTAKRGAECIENACKDALPSSWKNTGRKILEKVTIATRLQKLGIKLENGALRKTDIDRLLAAGNQADRSNLTKAGRALQKHGSRPGSVFLAAKGNPDAINSQAQKTLKGILEDTNVKVEYNRYSGIDIFSFSGKGARFNGKGELVGFLEPNERVLKWIQNSGS
jgi:hypothetical protein